MSEWVEWDFSGSEKDVGVKDEMVHKITADITINRVQVSLKQ